VLASFARGFASVGASPVILVTTLLAVLALWVAFTLYGAGIVASSGAMVQFMALPPARTFLDLGFLLQFGRAELPGALAFGVGIIMFRALLTGFLVAAIDDTLRAQGSWRRTLATGAHGAIGAFWVVLAFEVGFVVATLFVESLTLVMGAQVGGLLYFAWLIGGVYFFGYCEVVAVVERTGFRDSLVLAIRAARLPGREHALFVFSYEVVAIVLSTFALGRGIATATPSLTVWVSALLLAYLHVSVLAAFTWRWALVAEPVRAGAGARGSRPRRPSILGMLGPRS
jgi:hypothetical protein